MKKYKMHIYGKKGLEPEICEVRKGRNAFMGKKVWNLNYVK